MGDTSTMSRGQGYGSGAVSTVHRDITDERYRELRRPRKLRFYVNGDRYFRGKKLYITPHRYLNFTDLLGDLTGKLVSKAYLPYGVRQIFTPIGGTRVTDIEEFQDGGAYVCGGFEPFKGVQYGGEALERWSMGRPHQHNLWYDEYGDPHGYGEGYGGYGGRGGQGGRGTYGNNSFRPGKTLHGSYPRKKYPPGTFGKRDYLMGSDNANAKPKVITIVRNGPKPRSHVKLLLNRRSVQSFEQLMADVAEAFGPKWKNDKLRRLYTIKGRPVQSVSDFFRDDDIFIGVGNDKLTEGNVQDIIGELYPDNPYAQNLLKDFEKNRRRNKYTVAHRDPNDEPKKDSGLGDGSDGNGDNLSENEYVIYKGRPNFRDGQRMNQERGLAAKDERDRAHRRRQKMLDAERRALEEEKRKRGLVGKKEDPFKKQKEQKLREQRERDEAKRRQEEEDRRRQQAEEDERRRREREGADKADRDRAAREEAERKARERQKAAEDEERRRKEKEDEERRKKMNQDTSDKADRDAKAQADRDRDAREKADREREARERAERDREARERAERERQTKPKAEPVKPKERQIMKDDDVLKKYVPGKQLGDGNFAVVKQCKMKATGNDYAMKIIDKAKLKGKGQMVDNEIDIMKECAHPNIIKLYEDCETKDKIYLIEELVKGGDLFDAITQSVKFGEIDSASMMKDLCGALFYLHSRNIVHRDLKPENLLVCRNKDSTISLKVADFGLAMEVKEPIYTVCGTPTYVAPEILSEVGYGIEVDNWAAGVIGYILLCGFPPFRSADRNQTELFEFIKAGEYEFLSPYWDMVSSYAKDLMEKLIVVNIHQRFTAIDVLCHPWIMSGGDVGTMNPDKLRDIKNKGRDYRSELETEAKLARENWDNRHG